MSDGTANQGSKISDLNRKIIEVKKKIQLSESQRKANFEECDAKKREAAEKIARLKKEVKELQVEFARVKNNEEAAERAAKLSRETFACVKKRSVEETIATLDEDNIRMRKKLDMLRYRRKKLEAQLKTLLQEYDKLMGKKTQSKRTSNPEKQLKKEIIRLENQLERVNMMQMETDVVRKKYRAISACLKADATSFESTLQKLEENVKEQKAEIERLEKVKEEAVALRDTAKETLTRQEAEAKKTSKEREMTINDYRKRVEDRRIELERLERIIFPPTRGGGHARDDYDSESKCRAEEESDEIPKDELAILEETFVKLRSVTGVSRTEDVLNRFLEQRVTKERLQKMQATAEQEKMELEKKRQQLTAELEMLKFSETKDSDQNALEVESLNKQIEEERLREMRAKSEIKNVQDLQREIMDKFCSFSEMLRHVESTDVPESMRSWSDPFEVFEVVKRQILKLMEKVEEIDKLNIDNELANKMKAITIGTSKDTKVILENDQPLFPLFPTVMTPAAHQVQLSDDEDDIPTRAAIKRQAQLLVDAKSRRKGFTFKR